MAHVSPAAISSLFKRFEGLGLTAYKDSNGIWTIGYGHTGSDVIKGKTITLQQAEDLLRRDLEKFERGVENSLARPATQEQFDSMVSLAYNSGLDAFRKSVLLKAFNAWDSRGAAQQFAEWVWDDDSIELDLVRRRVAEIIHFLIGAQ